MPAVVSQKREAVICRTPPVDRHMTGPTRAFCVTLSIVPYQFLKFELSDTDQVHRERIIHRALDNHYLDEEGSDDSLASLEARFVACEDNRIHKYYAGCVDVLFNSGGIFIALLIGVLSLQPDINIGAQGPERFATYSRDFSLGRAYALFRHISRVPNRIIPASASLVSLARPHKLDSLVLGSYIIDWIYLG